MSANASVLLCTIFLVRHLSIQQGFALPSNFSTRQKNKKLYRRLNKQEELDTSRAAHALTPRRGKCWTQQGGVYFLCLDSLLVFANDVSRSGSVEGETGEINLAAVERSLGVFSALSFGGKRVTASATAWCIIPMSSVGTMWPWIKEETLSYVYTDEGSELVPSPPFSRIRVASRCLYHLRTQPQESINAITIACNVQGRVRRVSCGISIEPDSANQISAAYLTKKATNSGSSVNNRSKIGNWDIKDCAQGNQK